MLLFSIIIFSALVSDDIIHDFRTFHQARATEKVYLHLNKSLYTTDETIWFKAYLVSGSLHDTATLSATLYVDLININQNNIVASKRYQVRDGTAKGDFYLSDTLPSASYRIRAYTNWRRNFDQEYFYSTQIPIYNINASNPDWDINYGVTNYHGEDSIQLYFRHRHPDSSLPERYDLSITNENNTLLYAGVVSMENRDFFNLNFNIDPKEKHRRIYVDLSNEVYEERFVVQLDQSPILQIFPEGGSDIVAGLINRLAFEATDPLGNPIKFHGELIDQDSLKVLPITEIHEGRGMLIFNPRNGINYMIRIQHQDHWFYYPLPETKSKGLILSAINSYADALNLTIEKKDPTGEIGNVFTLIGQVRGEIYWNNKLELSEESKRFKIPKSAFPSGILQLTLFNSDDLPILERLVFINHEDYMQIHISTDKKMYKPREEVLVELKTTDSEDYPVTAHLSATVLDQNQFPESCPENIISYFLLSSDLKGEINNPAQYFVNKSRKTQLALDLLMMIRGWRRFKWEDVLSHNHPKITFLPERGFDLSGTLSQPWNDRPVEGRVVTAMIFGQNPEVLVATTDSIGRFCFSDLNFEDTISVVLRTASKRGNKQNFNLVLDTAKLPDILALSNNSSTNYTPVEFLSQSKLRREIKLAYVNDTTPLILDEIVIEGKKIDPEWERIKPYPEPEYSFKPDQFEVERFIYITDYLRARVPGLTVVGFGADASIGPLYGMGVSISQGAQAPTVYIDNVRINGSYINMIPFAMVETIDVVKSSIYGEIHIYTRKGLPNAPATKGIKNIKVAGYSIPREFYKINYIVQKDEHVMPDYRANLMWAPDLQTDINGNVSFSFFNSDLKTNIKVLVEGISEYGTPGIGELVYEIH